MDKIYYKKTKKDFICLDLNCLEKLLGTRAVSGNYHLYKIRKEKNKFFLPIKVVKERLKEIKLKKELIERKIKLIENAL